jgi:anti-anti-sigma regulatory factor
MADLTLVIGGPLDATTVGAVVELVNDQLLALRASARRGGRILLDVGAVDAIDPAAARRLDSARRFVASEGSELIFENAHEEFRTALERVTPVVRTTPGGRGHADRH